MLRLTIVLLFGMLAALFTLGEDRGQLRPGLAKAEAEGRLEEVWAEARARSAPVAASVENPAPVVAEVAAAPEPAPEPAPVAPAPVAAATVTLASNGPVVEVEASRESGRVVEEVFTLSALGNELVPGEDGTGIAAAITEAVTEPAPTPAGGTIWYVTADSVNVRAAPTTEAEVLDRLASGEAALLVTAVDSEWARIVIQGDGVEGYVALRYLSPEAP